MREIILTRGLKCFVDDDLYDVVKYYRWCAQITNHSFISTDYIAKRTVKIFNNPVKVYLHRLAAGVPRCFKVIYKDGNYLNYQYDNIRLEDRQGNKYKFHRFNLKSMYKGVVFDYYFGLWRAEFYKMVIGYYTNELDAARAYNIKMKEIYKNPGRGRLNQITIMERYEENNPKYRRRA